jgi:uncharacterized protein
MLPLRIVLDTNIIVSALLNNVGLPRTVLTVAVTRPARLYVSDEILKEYKTVSARPKFAISKGSRLQFLQLLKNRARLVTPLRKLGVTKDPADNIFLECAEAAAVDYLVTGNQKHFPRFWGKTKVISARDFVDLITPHLTG